MDTSSSDTMESMCTKLPTLIVASIHTLKRGNKKCGNEEVFQLVSESLENEINRKFFEENLETLIQKQQVKANCYGNRTCFSIPKEDQTNKTKASDTDNIIEHFINFKTHLIEQFEKMKSSFFVEVNQVKNQLLNKTDSASASSILERLIVQQQEQISILREQLDRKDKVIDKLLEKLERRDKVSFSHCCPRKVPPNIETTTSNSENGTTHTSENAGEEQPDIRDNPLNQENVQKEHQQKEKAKSILIIGDSIIKHVNLWDLSKKLKPKCKVMVRSFPGATTQCMNDYVKPSIRAQPDHFILHVGTNNLISDSTPTEVTRKVFDIAGRLKSDTCDVNISELITRMDNPDLDKKRIEVNTHLKEMCKEKNISLLIMVKESRLII